MAMATTKRRKNTWVPPLLLSGITQATHLLVDLALLIGECTCFDDVWTMRDVGFAGPQQLGQGTMGVPRHTWSAQTFTVTDLRTKNEPFKLQIGVRSTHSTARYMDVSELLLTSGDRISILVDFTGLYGVLSIRLNDTSPLIVCEDLNPSLYWMPYFYAHNCQMS